MQRSYLDYAMSVIVGRALPDVRDGLKPVHRRVIYAMYDGGYRPDKAFSKCARVVGDVMGQFHPHGDTAIYDALVRLVQPWTLRYPLALGQGNFGSPGNDGAAAPRYTETKMAPLAMEMVRDIDEDTVDFQDNYDGRTQEPSVLPARFPNLLVNGSVGIAVGMATNIPPHNLREVAAGALWYLEHPEATREELLEALMQRIKGPDFPTGAQILGVKGIKDAYRTGRGSITMRAVVNVEELQGRTCLVVTELPYQVNPDNLAIKIADLVKDGKIAGIADIRDETSGRTGQRLVIVLKRDAVAKVVLNNLYKHTQLQENFGANMLAIVDGVPRTLSIDGFIAHWVDHQIEVIVRRTQFRLRKAEERMHILRGYLKALDALDEVIALIRRSADRRRGARRPDQAARHRRAAGRRDPRAAAAPPRRARAPEDHRRGRRARARDRRLPGESSRSPERQRTIVTDELAEIVAKFGDERRTEIMLGFDGDMRVEDLIPEEEMVVTVTRGGYIKRTRSDNYRSQHRGGKGVKGAQLRADDVVEHFFVTTTHHWLLFFTNTGRVYRAKAYEIQEAGRDAKGQHVANLLAMQPDEEIAADPRHPRLRGREVPRARHPRRAGQEDRAHRVRHEPLAAASSRSTCARATSWSRRCWSTTDDDVLLVSRKGMSMRFTATDEALRPMGRSTSGVIGMHFRDGDACSASSSRGRCAEAGESLTRRGRDGEFVFVVTEGGYAKRTAVDQYRLQGRGGLGIKVAKLSDDRGDLAGALIVDDDDEVLVVLASGKVVRSASPRFRPRAGTPWVSCSRGSRTTTRIIAIAKNSERNLVEAGGRRVRRGRARERTEKDEPSNE